MRKVTKRYAQPSEFLITCFVNVFLSEESKLTFLLFVTIAYSFQGNYSIEILSPTIEAYYHLKHTCKWKGAFLPALIRPDH